jgi:periplasmic divalent cation tolerance protein
MDQVILVMTNLPNAASAQALAHALVQARLAACVNLLPGVQSFYRWQGKIEQASEVTLIIKTTQARYQQIEQAILAAHPYDLPEIVALPLTGHAPYLHWIKQETAQHENA